MTGGFRFPHRIYPILDELDGNGRSYVELTDACLQAGVRFLQLRIKGRPTREMIEIARLVVQRTDAAGASLIVNDRADIAALVDAAGVHLGQDDLPPAAAREMVGPDKIVGFSTHNLAQAQDAAAAGAADYIGFGPIFLTTSKVNPDPAVGLSTLRQVRRCIDTPIVAIGGISEDRVADVLGAGADAVAMIGDLVRAVDLAAKLQRLVALP